MEEAEDLIEELHTVESKLQQAAVEEIERHTTASNRQEAMLVVQHYTRLNRTTGGPHDEEAFQEQLKAVQLRSIQIGRDTVQELEETGQISPGSATQLRQTINYDELLVLDNSREA